MAALDLWEKEKSAPAVAGRLVDKCAGSDSSCRRVSSDFSWSLPDADCDVLGSFVPVCTVCTDARLLPPEITFPDFCSSSEGSQICRVCC